MFNIIILHYNIISVKLTLQHNFHYDIHYNAIYTISFISYDFYYDIMIYIIT